MQETILICEDEPHIQELLEYNLGLDGYSTHVVGRGDQVLEAVNSLKPHLLLLDLMLPGLSGTEVCRLLREKPAYAKLPVIIVSAKDTENDRIHGLELGADDYVTKPFSPKEVVARIKAVLRRSQGVIASELANLECNGVKIDLREHKVFVQENELQLTLTEFKILKELLTTPGQVISRRKLGDSCDIIYHEATASSRTIDVHLVSLRKKMGQAGDFIETVRGVGYRFRS